MLVSITIAGVLKAPDGSLLKGRRLEVKPEYVFGGGGVIVPSNVVKATTDTTTAAYSFELLTPDTPGAYVRYRVRFTTSNQTKRFDLTDDLTSVSLDTLINAFDPAQSPAASSDWLDHEARIVSLEGSIASGVTDGDKGDITVSGGGTIWTVDGGVGGSSDWGDIGGTLSDQTDLQTALNAKQALDSDLTAIAALSPSNDDLIQRKAGAWTNRTVAQFKTDLSLTKSDVGLGNVDNTSDANKPISSATQTALDAKQPLDSDLSAIAGLSASNDDFLQRKAGNWANRTIAQVKSDLSLSGTNTGDQTSVTGNAGTATALQTARTIDGQSFDGSANITVIAPGTVAATGKTTPVDADVMPIADSAASNVLKKLTWANLKATLKTYFDTLYVALTGDQTVAGIKTFSSFPVTPSASPSADYQVANKKYVDDSITAGGGYTDEQAQDAVGGIVDSTIVYTDGTPLLSRAALTGDVTAPAGSNATTIANDAVTNAKAANMAANTIKGRITGSTGDPEDLTAANVRTIINVADGATANDTDANLKARANHTGTQTASTISDFNSAALSAAPAETTTTVGTLISGATGKTTPVDADSLGLSDSAASNVLKKLTWANLKATLKTYLDTLYQPVDSDLTTIAGLTATTDNFLQAKSSAWASRTIAQVKADLGLTGTNSGDQTSIVGITGTKAEFNTAVSDGDLVFQSDIVDEDDMASDSATKVPTQQSVKAYVDANITGGSVDVSGTPTAGQFTKWTDANTIEGVDGIGIHDLTAKGTPVLADEIIIADSAAGYVGKSATLTNIKTALGLTGTNSGDQTASGLGLGTSDSPQFAGVNIGHATDTTITRTGAGDIAVEGNAVYRAGGTDVPVADGGTGSSTAAGAATNLGLGTGDSPQFTGVNVGHPSDTTISRSAAGRIAVEGIDAVLLTAAQVMSAKSMNFTAAHGTDDTYEGLCLTGLNNSGGVTQWDAVYLNGSSQWVLADANGTNTYPARGVAVATVSTGNATTVLIRGTVRNDAWNWTPGGAIYLSGTAGGLTQTAPSSSGDKVQVVGYALTADIAFFDFNNTFLTIA